MRTVTAAHRSRITSWRKFRIKKKRRRNIIRLMCVCKPSHVKIFLPLALLP